MGHRWQKLKSRIPLKRLLFTSFSAVSLALLILPAFFWARGTLELKDVVFWPRHAGWGAPVRLTSEESSLLLEIPAEPGEQLDVGPNHYQYSTFEWESRPHGSDLIKFRNAVEVEFHRLSGGGRSFVLKAPWWWLVLIFAILPALRLRASIKSRGIVFSLVAKSAILLPLMLLAALNFTPNWLDRTFPSVRGPFYSYHPDTPRYGFPFVARASDPLDDGTQWVRWSAGGVISNIMAAVALSFLTAVIVQTIAAVIRRIRAKWQSKPGHCKVCGYNLTGNTSGLCPECGTNRSLEVAMMQE